MFVESIHLKKVVKVPDHFWCYNAFSLMSASGHAQSGKGASIHIALLNIEPLGSELVEEILGNRKAILCILPTNGVPKWSNI
jgi:hypothetical protein